MAIISTSQIPIFTIGAGGNLNPTEGAKTLGPLPCNWASGSSFPFEITRLSSTGAFSAILCVFVDNGSVSSEIVITCGLTGQVVKIPATTQAYVPVLIPNPGTFVVSSAAVSGVTNIFAMNFEVPPIIWTV